MPAWPGQCEGGEDTRQAREAAGWDRDKACREGPGKIGLLRTVECKEWKCGSNQLSDLPVMTCHTSPQTDKKPRTSKDMIPSQSKHRASRTTCSHMEQPRIQWVLVDYL